MKGNERFWNCMQEVQGSDHNKVWHGALQIQNETGSFLLFASEKETRVMHRPPMKHPFLKRNMKIERFQGQQ